MLPDAGANAALEPAPLPAGRDATSTSRATRCCTRARARRRWRMLAAARAAGLDRLGRPVERRAARRAPARRRSSAWVAGADLLLPNRDEAAVLSGHADPEAAARALAAHAREVVVKLGADGALWTDGGARRARAGARRCPTPTRPAPGDAFAAGLLAARLAGAEPARRAARGLRARRRGRGGRRRRPLKRRGA